MHTYTAADLAASTDAEIARDLVTVTALEYKRFRSLGYDHWHAQYRAKSSAKWKVSPSYARDMGRA